LEHKRCYAKHIDKAVVISRIFSKIPGKPEVPKLWNCWSSIGVPREEDRQEGVDVKIILSLPMFKGLALGRCENLTHKREDVLIYKVIMYLDLRHRLNSNKVRNYISYRTLICRDKADYEIDYIMPSNAKMRNATANGGQL
jgi:hypothetical protein